MMQRKRVWLVAALVLLGLVLAGGTQASAGWWHARAAWVCDPCVTPVWNCCPPVVTTCWTPWRPVHRIGWRHCGWSPCWWDCCWDPCWESCGGWVESCCGPVAGTVVSPGTAAPTPAPTPAPAPPPRPEPPKPAAPTFNSGAGTDAREPNSSAISSPRLSNPPADLGTGPVNPPDSSILPRSSNPPAGLPKPEGDSREPSLRLPLSPKAGLERRDAAGLLTVDVPAGVKVYINGQPTRSEGSRREYVSAGLEKGRQYRFEVKAAVPTENGEPVWLTKSVVLTAGDHAHVVLDDDLGFNRALAAQK